MHGSLRNFLLKSIPYLLAIAGGAVLYWLTADKIQSPDLRDLVNNIAASLLSIPLVFLLYDYSNYIISRQLSRAQTDNTHEKIDAVLIDIVLLLRQMLGIRGTLTLGTLNKMVSMSVREISEQIRMTSAHIKTLQEYYNELDELVYRSSGINIFSMVQLQALTTLTRNMLHLINAHKFHHNRRDTAKYIEKIIRFIADWVDADAAVSLHFRQLLNDTEPTASRGRGDTATRKK